MSEQILTAIAVLSFVAGTGLLASIVFRVRARTNQANQQRVLNNLADLLSTYLDNGSMSGARSLISQQMFDVINRNDEGSYVLSKEMFDAINQSSFVIDKKADGRVVGYLQLGKSTAVVYTGRIDSEQLRDTVMTVTDKLLINTIKYHQLQTTIEKEVQPLVDRQWVWPQK